MSDREFLEWIRDRIVHVYGESPNTDFVLRLGEIAQALQGGEPVVFTCHGNNAPAYGCNKPNDMSGTYYKAPQPVVPEMVHILSIVNGNIWHTEASENLKLAKDFELRLYADADLLSAGKETV
jgi:hypothetical protein